MPRKIISVAINSAYEERSQHLRSAPSKVFRMEELIELSSFFSIKPRDCQEE